MNEFEIESLKIQKEMLDLSKSMYKQMRTMNVRLQETLNKIS